MKTDNNEELSTTHLIQVILKDLTIGSSKAPITADKISVQIATAKDIKDAEVQTDQTEHSSQSVQETRNSINKPTFSIDADDSSDEEEVRQRRKPPLAEGYRRFSIAHPEFPSRVVFDAHSFATEKLYSGEVEKLYREMKKEKLAGSKILTELSPEQISLKDWLITGLRTAFNHILPKPPEFSASYSVKEIVEDFWQTNAAELEKNIVSICSNEREILKACRFKDNIPLSHLRINLLGIYNIFSKYFEDRQATFNRSAAVNPEVIDNFKIVKTRFYPQKDSKTAEDISMNNSGALGDSFKILQRAALETIRNHFVDYKVLKKTQLLTGIKYTSPDSKGESRNNKIDSSPDHAAFPLLSRQTKIRLKSAANFKQNGATNAGTNFDDYFSIERKNIGWNYILKSFIDDLFTLEQNGHFLSANNVTLKEYCSFDQFWVRLQEALNASYKQLPIERKFLPNSHPFQARNHNQFFAALRLARRSRIRKIRQCKSDAIFQETSAVSHLHWQFTAEQVVLEKQTITPNQGCSDYVENLSSYSDIYKLLSRISLSNREKINDVLFAQLIRQTLQGKDLQLILKESGIEPKIRKSLLEFIPNLTYLLFGTEVVRNPASLVIHQMMLDLIISGYYNWHQMFAEIKMPMATVNAVSAARQLNNAYKPYMFFPYKYHGSDKNGDPKTIYELEEKIISAWLLNVKGITYINGDIESILKTAWDEWFGATEGAIQFNLPSSP